MYGETMVQFTCKIPSTTAQAIQALAVIDNSSIGDVARRLLEDGAQRQISRNREAA